MNNMPNVVNVARSQKHRSTFPLDFQHLTTIDFGKTNVTYATELVPGDEFDINISSMIQLAPMVVPTMGQCKLFTRAFFVPYRFVWRYWEDFFAQLTVSAVDGTVVPSTVPTFLPTDLFEFFIDSQYGLTTIVTQSVADFTYLGSSYKFTYEGRIAYQLALGLGYNLVPLSTDINFTEPYSFLPLLSLVKVFRDYYVNPNFDYSEIDDAIFNIDSNLRQDTTEDRGQHKSYLGLFFAFCLYGWFESDVFTSAWAGPENVNYVPVGKFKQQRVSTGDFGDSGYIYQNDDGTGAGLSNTNDYVTSPYSPSESNSRPSLSSLGNLSPSSRPISSLVRITELGLNLLKQVRNFVIRQNVAGGRYVDQLLSRFGIHLSDNETKRAKFVGTFESDIHISRVDATAAGTDGLQSSSLGDFTGRGTMSGNGHFHFKNDDNDFGFFVVISHLMPRTSYFQGDKMHTRHVNFNDFFNPDLEDVGMAPIPNLAVFNDYRNSSDVTTNASVLDSVFGFAPNYWEYKSQMDYLSGDFRCDSINQELKSFQLMRELDPPVTIGQGSDTSNAVLGEEFMRMNEKSVNRYNRIFLDQNNDADHFIASFMFNIRATRPMNSLGNSMVALLNEHGNDVGELVKVRPNGKYF